MYRLHDSLMSCNAWKVRILLRQLGIPFERVTHDLAKGAAKTDAFTAMNPLQRVPVLELEDGRAIAESGAILLYLAEGTPLLPTEPLARAQVTSWLFFEQADLLKPLALPRFYNLRGTQAENAERMRFYHEAGKAGLSRLDGCLAGREWITDAGFTIADIALYGYVSQAHFGGYDMGIYQNIGAWLRRVEAQPGWEPLVVEATS
ncbi:MULTISPECIES: glutathione S-transferase family protein [Chelativorans]|jgi:glutathione S-transferase|uniref:Glutathione S-transferase-like protein n=1 Tax=Chelativorans sp. (strain BNC1) TaxID=266779 RepID=Q11F94_CHESB|nr:MULTISPECIES: glutathione S-transferase family protein [Chelativorans]